MNEHEFWSNVVKTETCWLWTGRKDKDGYGEFRKNTRAHRFSWELVNGPRPKDVCICHKCDVRACVNPDHMFLGSRLENNLDCKAKGRNARGTNHNKNKLTEQQIHEIRAATGSEPEMAKAYNVRQSTIHNIRKRKIWTHVPEVACESKYYPRAAYGDGLGRRFSRCLKRVP